MGFIRYFIHPDATVRNREIARTYLRLMRQGENALLLLLLLLGSPGGLALPGQVLRSVREKMQ